MAGPTNRKLKLNYGQPGGVHGGSPATQRKWIRLGVMIILINLALYVSVFGGGSSFNKAKEKQRKKEMKKLRKQKRKQNRIRKKQSMKNNDQNPFPKGVPDANAGSPPAPGGIDVGTKTVAGDVGRGDDDKVNPKVSLCLSFFDCYLRSKESSLISFHSGLWIVSC